MISDIKFCHEDGRVILKVLDAPESDFYGSGYVRPSVQVWRYAEVEDLLEVAEHLRNRYSQMVQP